MGRPVSGFDLDRMLNRLLEPRPSRTAVRDGAWTGFQLGWEEAGMAYVAWLLRSRNIVVYATYSTDLPLAEATLERISHVISSLRSMYETPNRITPRKAVAIGQLIVNLPVIIILAGVPIAALTFAPTYTLASIPVAFALAWLWWSLSVPRWRAWAIRQGAPVYSLQLLAQQRQLVWPKGSLFEKTELRGKHKPPW